ncbi:hypothetical protein AOC36_00085 [Erysipelothrix larvae]|uniref:CYTH domain-containing protein n=1 Tax=Erysipelothrix larvae TaxID=1514105 RepID=A0A120JTD0_9FIRM|nr:CYTH domain-containing protein [Erysipelothrix larvae]AMC92445.1 hypothetical protein AOC36_00085 [Erysipelothrix larvae]
MKTHLEIEYKTALTREEYQEMMYHFPFEGPISQSNTYYDTEDTRLQNQGVMCRIRKEGETTLFTLKEPQEEGVLEYEFYMLGEQQDNKRAQDILLPFHVGLSELKEVTFSNTVRFVYKDVYGTWCLDVTQFPHHKDYELEYELHKQEDRARSHFLSVLAELNIEYVESPPKFLRAINSSPEAPVE